MRHFICTALLTGVLSISALAATELNTAQAQQLVSAAQAAPVGGKAIEATLSIGGKNVAFSVSRDSVGNVIARPKADVENANLGISHVSIQLRANANGALVPVTMVVIGSDQSIASYSMQLNQDGSIASLYQAGSFGGGGAGGGSQSIPVKGGVGAKDGGTLATTAATVPTSLPNDSFPGFTSGQQGLPAGAGTSDVSQSRP